MSRSGCSIASGRSAWPCLAHHPHQGRGWAEETLRDAWAVADGQAARAALERLVDAWSGTHPGAASRLRQEIEETWPSWLAAFISAPPQTRNGADQMNPRCLVTAPFRGRKSHPRVREETHNSPAGSCANASPGAAQKCGQCL